MRALLVVAIGASGCYSPGYADCEVTCATLGGCPEGLACVAGLCRSEGQTGACAAGADDADPDDGDPSDGTDGPLGSGDEDGDGLADGVDPCPISANNVDTDGDGVGDPCEPIASGDDTLLRFEGFNDGIPADALVLGEWMVAGGKATSGSGANLASSITFPVTSPASRRETIVAKVTVDALFSTSSDPTGAGPVTRTDATGELGIQCGIGRDPISGTDHLLLVKIAAGADGTVVSSASIATPGTSMILSITRNPDNDIFACHNGTTTIARAPTSPVPNPNAPRAGIRTRSMAASFDWVMILSTE